MTTTEIVRKPVLLGPDGEPWYGTPGDDDGQQLKSQAVVRSFTSFLHALSSLDASPSFRSREPFANHAWVYAVASAFAMNIAQAPLQVVRETDTSTADRKGRVLRQGLKWTGVPRGTQRRAVERHLETQSRLRGAVMRGVEPFLEHPFMTPLTHPNYLMTGRRSLIIATVVWLCIRGECDWILLSATGDPLAYDEDATEVWPVNPDALTPSIVDNRLVGWWFNVPTGMGLRSRGRQLFLQPNEVVQFKRFNPYDPVRGLSPIAAAASEIELDILAARHSRSTLLNGANPGGVLVDRNSQGGSFVNRPETKKIEDTINAKHAGVENNRRLMILEGGMEWLQIAMTPQDMEYIDQRKWDRETILGIYSCPKSVLSITDDLNYSVQLSQDFNFWDKGLLPVMRLIEDTLDSTVMYPEGDNVMMAFDLSRIHALKAGLSDDIKTVIDLTGPAIHMPPRDAFALVGRQVPEYPGDDEVVVTGIVGAYEPGLPPPTQPVAPDPNAAPGDAGAQPGQPGPSRGDGPQSAPSRPRNASLSSAQKFWQVAMREVHDPTMAQWSPLWRKWVRQERVAALAKFDHATRGLVRTAEKAITEVGAVLLDLRESQLRLDAALRPAYATALERVFDFTVATDFGGVPIFELDDPRLASFFDRYRQTILGSAPKTMQSNLRKSLLTGMNDGESIQTLRDRVSEIYNTAASSAKTLQVARTEASNFMNGARDTMFALQQVTNEEWVTAGDEHVRENHVRYGDSGPHPRGFNYMALSGMGRRSGVLAFPGDPRAPAGETVNCFVDDVPIETSRGRIPISSIQEGDEVLTHRGRYRRVVRIRSDAKYSGTVIALRTIYGEVRVTAAHPFLTDAGWNRADRLKPGDLLRVPGLPANIEQSDLVVDRNSQRVDRVLGVGIPALLLGAHRIKRDELGAAALESEKWEERPRNLSGSPGNELKSLLREPTRMRSVARHGEYAVTEKVADVVKNADLRVRDDHADSGFAGHELSHAEGGLAVAEPRDVGQFIDHGPHTTSFVRVESIEIAECVGQRVWNFAVDEDESYVAAGLISHNCRCVKIAVQK